MYWQISFQINASSKNFRLKFIVSSNLYTEKVFQFRIYATIVMKALLKFQIFNPFIVGTPKYI